MHKQLLGLGLCAAVLGLAGCGENAPFNIMNYFFGKCEGNDSFCPSEKKYVVCENGHYQMYNCHGQKICKMIDISVAKCVDPSEEGKKPYEHTYTNPEISIPETQPVLVPPEVIDNDGITDTVPGKELPQQPAVYVDASDESPNDSGLGAPGERAVPVESPSVSKHDSSSPRIRFREPIITGTVDNRRVQSLVHQHKRDLLGCYESGLQKNKNLQGTIILEWTISSYGNVLNAKIKSSTMNQPTVEKCLLNTINKIRFPTPKDGQPAKVEYPFIFEKNS